MAMKWPPVASASRYLIITPTLKAMRMHGTTHAITMRATSTMAGTAGRAWRALPPRAVEALTRGAAATQPRGGGSRHGGDR